MAQSLYRQASLVMNPYGAKDDLLPSIKPTDGSGDFTFSRDGAGASPATRVNASGFIEKGRENALVQSNTFDTTWSQTATTSIVGGQSGYDGSSDAWLWTAAIGLFTNITQSNSIGSGVVTLSVYAKAGNTNFIALQPYGSGAAFIKFNLSTGAVHEISGSPIDYGIESVGGGWYRCFVTDNYTSAFVSIYLLDSTGNFSNSATDSIYIQDAQLEQGLIATDVITTTTAPVSAGLLGDMPRLDYSGGATCPSLLLEPSRTNAVTQSEYFDGGSLTNTTISAEYNTADTLSPEGVYNAAKLTATGSFPRYYNFPSTSDNTDIVISSFAKAGDASVYSLFASDKNLDAAQVYFDLSAGTATLAGTSVLTPVGYDIEPMGNGWYRCWLSINTGTGASSVQIRPIAHAQGQSGGWSGSNYVYAYGAQYETGSYPTSYIPTYGSAAPRAHDVCLISGANATAIIDKPAMTLYAEIDHDVANTNTTILSNLRKTSGGSYGDFISFIMRSDSEFQIEVRSNNTAQGTIRSSAVSSGTHKVAAVVENDNLKLFVDGVLQATDTSVVLPTGLNEIYLGGYPDTNVRYGTKNQYLYFPTALTDAECIALTTI